MNTIDTQKRITNLKLTREITQLEKKYSIYQLLYNFCRNPFTFNKDKRTPLEIIRGILAFIPFSIALSTVFIIIINLIVPDLDKNLSNVNATEAKDFNFIIFFITIIVGPIFEELLYRGIFVKKVNILTSIIRFVTIFILFYIFVANIISPFTAFFLKAVINNSVFLNILLEVFNPILIFIYSIIFSIEVGRRKTIEKLLAIPKVFNISVIISSCLFGLSHFSNYQLNNNKSIILAFTIYFFYIISQLVLGFFATMLANKYSFYWAVLAHIINNLLIMSFYYPVTILGSASQSDQTKAGAIFSIIIFIGIVISMIYSVIYEIYILAIGNRYKKIN